jgi:hypothetical protein
MHRRSHAHGSDVSRVCAGVNSPRAAISVCVRSCEELLLDISIADRNHLPRSEVSGATSMAQALHVHLKQYQQAKIHQRSSFCDLNTFILQNSLTRSCSRLSCQKYRRTIQRRSFNWSSGATDSSWVRIRSCRCSLKLEFSPGMKSASPNAQCIRCTAHTNRASPVDSASITAKTSWLIDIKRSQIVCWARSVAMWSLTRAPSWIGIVKKRIRAPIVRSRVVACAHRDRFIMSRITM